MKRLLFVILLAVAVCAVGGTSFVCARARADSLVAKMPDLQPWERVDSRFTLVRSITGRSGPSWDFSYEPRNAFITGPFTVQMNLLAQPVATNPLNALEELKKLP